MDTSDLAKRMKEYEKAGQRYLTRRMPVLLRYFLEQEVTESDRVVYHEGLLSKFIETPKIEVNLNETIKN